MATRRKGSTSLLGLGGVLLVMLLGPALVVLTFMRALPEGSSGGFRRRGAATAAGGGRAEPHRGPRLIDTLDDQGARQMRERLGGASPDARREQIEAAVLGRNAGAGHHSGQQLGGGANSHEQQAGGVKVARDQEQQQEAGAGQGHQTAQQQAVQQVQQQQQAAQQQQQEQQEQQKQLRRQDAMPRDRTVQQGQVVRGEAQPGDAQEAPPDPQQQQQRQEAYKSKVQAQVPQQLHPAVVHDGAAPRWPSTLPVGKGTPHARPGCGDRSDAQQCRVWADRGDCDSNPALMYHGCAAACGLCQVVYLHGDEVQREVEVAPGVRMPTVGYGTAGLGDLTADAVFTAIRLGYRLVDSAQAYEWYEEDLVGWGWRASGIKREHLFITSKQHPQHHGYWTTLEMFAQSQKDLQSEGVDLMLLHYPECWGDLCPPDKQPEGTWQDSWFALEQVMREGKLRAAGVSNFGLAQLRELVQITEAKPAVLQANSDLLNPNWELQAFCRRHGILFQGYSTLGGQHLAQGGRNPVLGHPALVATAKRLGRTPAQVALRWALQHGQAVIPRTSQVDHMESNLDLFSFDLSDEEMLALDAVGAAAALAAGGGTGHAQNAEQQQRQGDGGDGAAEGGTTRGHDEQRRQQLEAGGGA